MEKNPKKNPKNFYCAKCDFLSSNKKDYNRHLLTRKHQMDNMDNNRIKKKTPYLCMVCGKSYKYASGLSKHKKKCMPSSVDSNVKTKPKKQLTTYVDKNDIDVEKELLKQEVSELRTMMKKMIKTQQKQTENFTEAIKNVIPKVGNTYNKMSINIYLNEKCKNAMNLTDFVDNVNVSLEDLMYTKDHGFVKGISNIFVKQLQDMEPTQRPIHCSDKKRLQFYVKDEDKWEKDNTHEKINKTIDKITFKQIKNIKLWEKQHPNYLEDEKLLTEWQTMIRNITGNTVDGNEKNKSSIKREIGTTVEVKNELVDKKI